MERELVGLFPNVSQAAEDSNSKRLVTGTVCDTVVLNTRHTPETLPPLG